MPSSSPLKAYGTACAFAQTVTATAITTIRKTAIGNGAPLDLLVLVLVSAVTLASHMFITSAFVDQVGSGRRHPCPLLLRRAHLHCDAKMIRQSLVRNVRIWPAERA